MQGTDATHVPDAPHTIQQQLDRNWWDSTKLSDFAACPYKAYLRHELDLVPLMMPVEPSYGIAAHAALKAYYDGDKNPFNAFCELWTDRETDSVKYTQANFAKILEQYLKKYPTEPFKILSTEQLVETKVGDHPFLVRFDGLAEEHSALRVLEHKFTSRIGDSAIDRYEMRAQLAAQVYAARDHFGRSDINYVLVNVVRQGYDPDKPRYQYVEGSDGKRHRDPVKDFSDCFLRFRVEITDELLADWQESTNQLISEWLVRRRSGIWPRTGKHSGMCSQYKGCQYRQICRNVADAGSIIENDYRKEYWHPGNTT